MTQVILSHLTKRFTNHPPAVNDLSLQIPEGRITALLGPSGCGKTTTLKMIAGLIQPTQGDICFDGHSILREPPEKRGAAMVFQNHLLFPYLTLEENIGFGLKMRGEQAKEIRKKVRQMMERVQLTGLENAKPNQLSGGQKQRAALARALIIQPRVLLLDEPLSNLDAHLRFEMRELIHDIQREQQMTTVFVTHDQEEAVILADQIALMFQGTLQQVGAPGTFYERPATFEVARFFGTRNFLPGTGNGSSVQTSMGNIQIGPEQAVQGPTVLAIRPENIQILENFQKGSNIFTGKISSCIYLGTGARLHVKVGQVSLEVNGKAALVDEYHEGDSVALYLPPAKLWALGSDGFKTSENAPF